MSLSTLWDGGMSKGAGRLAGSKMPKTYLRLDVVGDEGRESSGSIIIIIIIEAALLQPWPSGDARSVLDFIAV